MSCRAFLCLPLFLLPLFVWAGRPTNEFLLFLKREGRRDEMVVAEKGQLKVGSGGPGIVWFVDGTRLKSKATGRYLAYDLAGKDTKVFLVERPGENTDWQVRQPDKRREEDKADIQASTGPLRGWYLSEDEGRILLRKDVFRKIQVRRNFE